MKGFDVHMRKKPLDLLLYAWMRMLKRFDGRQTDISCFDAGKVRAILAVSSTAIGDTFLSYPGIRALRCRYPKAKIVGHFSRRYSPLFENNSDLDEIIPYHGGYRKFFRTISDFRKQHTT